MIITVTRVAMSTQCVPVEAAIPSCGGWNDGSGSVFKSGLSSGPDCSSLDSISVDTTAPLDTMISGGYWLNEKAKFSTASFLSTYSVYHIYTSAGHCDPNASQIAQVTIPGFIALCMVTLTHAKP